MSSLDLHSELQESFVVVMLVAFFPGHSSGGWLLLWAESQRESSVDDRNLALT